MVPRIFWIHYNRFGQKRGECCWIVRTGHHNYEVKSVDCRIPITTVFRGDSAPQPRAYLRGVGVVRIRQGRAIITR